MAANYKVVKFATYDTELPRMLDTGSPVSENVITRMLDAFDRYKARFLARSRSYRSMLPGPRGGKRED